MGVGDQPYQDWKEVVLRKKAPSGAAARTTAAVNEAGRKGQVAVEKKINAGNKTTHLAASANKLDQDTGAYEHDKLPASFGVALQQARQRKELSQEQLAQKVNEKPATIREYENGRAIPEGNVIQKLNRELGVTLPRVLRKRKTTGEDE